MKVLFATLCGCYPLHFFTELELMFLHKEKNDDIYVLKCNADHESGCGFSFEKNEILCQRRMDFFDRYLKVTGLENYIQLIDVDFNVLKNKSLSIETLAQLKGVTFEGHYDVGLGIASSLISSYRDYNPVITKKIVNKSNDYYNELISYVSFLKDKINQYNIDQIYVFNGRFPYHRMTLRVAQQLHIPICVHERAYVTNKYSLYYNTYPHDINYIKALIEEIGEISDCFNERIKVAEKWYGNIRNGKRKHQNNFIKNQLTDSNFHLPRDKKNIAIFISSQDEFETIPEWHPLLYKDQNEALEKIITYENWNDNIHFYLRVHPNLMKLDNEQTRYIETISSPLMTVIPANSSISTYQLLDECDIVLVFGSAVGIEACFYGKPVILAGRSIYEDFKGFFRPKTHTDLCEYINNFPNVSIDLNAAYKSAVKYAWYCHTLGIEFKYFKQIGFNRWIYKGPKTLKSYYYISQELASKLKVFSKTYIYFRKLKIRTKVLISRLNNHSSFYIYPAGYTANVLIESLLDMNPTMVKSKFLGFVDKNPDLSESKISGYVIHSKDVLQCENQHSAIIIASDLYKDEIYRELSFYVNKKKLIKF